MSAAVSARWYVTRARITQIMNLLNLATDSFDLVYLLSTPNTERNREALLAVMLGYRPLIVAAGGTELVGYRQYGATVYFSALRPAA